MTTLAEIYNLALTLAALCLIDDPDVPPLPFVFRDSDQLAIKPGRSVVVTVAYVDDPEPIETPGILRASLPLQDVRVEVPEEAYE